MGVWWRMLKPKQAVPIASHFTPWRPADFGPLEHLCGVGCDRAHPILNKGAPSHLSRPCLVRKNFQDSLSNRIFGRMHGALNIDKNKN